MAKYVSHGSRAGATARPHLGVDKLILRRPDEHCLRASDRVHERALPRSLSHRARPPVDILPGRDGRVVLINQSLPPGCQVNYILRTALVSINGEGSAVRRARRPVACRPQAGTFGSSHAHTSPARRVTASVVASTWSPDARRMGFGAVITHGGPNSALERPSGEEYRGSSSRPCAQDGQPKARRSPKRPRAEAWSSRPTIETRGVSRFAGWASRSARRATRHRGRGGLER